LPADLIIAVEKNFSRVIALSNPTFFSGIAQGSGIGGRRTGGQARQFGRDFASASLHPFWGAGGRDSPAQTVAFRITWHKTVDIIWYELTGPAGSKSFILSDGRSCPARVILRLS
jgi:hypothetical protein